MVGAEVRNERSWRRVGIVVSEGTVRGMVSPDSSLTKIWKLSGGGDADVDVEEAFEDEREVRMLGDSVWSLVEWIDRFMLHKVVVSMMVQGQGK